MRSILAASFLLAFAILFEPAPAAAIKKTSYPEVKVEVPAEAKAEPTLEAMRKKLANAISHRNAGLLYELVGSTFFWTTNGDPNEQFDKSRDALHNFKVAFGFRQFGHNSDSQNTEDQLWEVLEDITSGPGLFQMDENPGVLCGPLGAEPADDAVMNQASGRIENEDEDSEWVYSLTEITLTEKPGGGDKVETVSKIAMPIAATHPPSQALGNNPLPTHYQLLLPSGRTGWVDVHAVQPLAVDKLCYGKGPGGDWKIVGYEQNS
ncbi:MAG TPA: hypothetical protein VKT73_05985 [Xanthobacteraceae bacterium]|nr:hypothetical protein [Xanthobacteraceae bacterium]